MAHAVCQEARSCTIGSPLPNRGSLVIARNIDHAPRLHPDPFPSTIPVVFAATRLRQLLEPFGLELTSAQTDQTLAYLELLLRWNQKINLTAIRNPDECVTRHFGESLFVSNHFRLEGHLLDIGSGAGFPGLALKIAFPKLSVTLLEPVAKKRAFLKEAARVCGFGQVEVRADRLEDLARQTPPPLFDFATMRAVGNLGTMVPLAANCLKPGGNLLLWLTRDQASELPSIEADLKWRDPLPVPLSHSGEIWSATKPERNSQLRPSDG